MGKDLSKTVTVIVQKEKISIVKVFALNISRRLWDCKEKLLLIIYQFEIIF